MTITITQAAREQRDEIAHTILQQLGGIGRIRAMTGAHAFIGHEAGVSFQFPNRMRSRPNYVKVDLDLASDTYIVTFGRVAKYASKVLRVVEGVYCDQLIALFERETGLYLSL